MGVRGQAADWLGGADVQAQLALEYRKAAEAATARGDFRRAAFIYGKLLRDYRQAAAVLSRGGLHHDSAILYLEKVADFLSAAREFEAGGEFDRAVQLYRQRAQHVLAGDLLRKLGEEQQAVAEYELALEQMLGTQQYLSAGELALEKLSRPERALECFRAGWDQRPRRGGVCLRRLVQLLAERSEAAEMLTLLDEAGPYLEQQGSDADCSSFYSDIVRLAERPNLSAVRDLLLDRALMGLAGRLRTRSQVETSPGSLVATLFGLSGVWAPAQVSDAEAALKGTLQTRKAEKQPRGQRAIIQTRLHEGTISAACVAGESGNLFVAFEDGALRWFNPAQGITEELPSLPGVCSLATEPRGMVLLALSEGSEVEYQLASFHVVEGRKYSRLLTRKVVSGLGASPQLAPLIRVGFEPVGVVWWAEGFVVFQGSQALPVERNERINESLFPPWHGALLVPAPECNRLLLVDEQSAFLYPLPFQHPNSPGCGALGWTARPAPGLLSSQVFRASRTEAAVNVDVLRIDEESSQVIWSRLTVSDKHQFGPMEWATSKSGKYLGAALLTPPRLAAIREGGIDWLRIHGRHLEVVSSTEINLTGACGCFFSPPTGELLILCRDGYLLRVAVPQ